MLVIHGGTARGRETLKPEREQAMRADMLKALAAGRDALAAEGATALDGVQAAVCVLEDSPLFNAGRGAVFTADERNELDASIMEGTKLNAGAVAGLTIVKNPILAARAVMERTEHVLLMGHGAEQFCREQKLELVDPSYFRTEERLEELRKVQAEEKAGKTSAVGADLEGNVAQTFSPLTPGPSPARGEGRTWKEYGTVGAVAVDKVGHVAAGTSTGGMTNKRHGRVGDSPIIGAGTYADDRSCGVSCTGHGEFFIRFSAAQSIATRVRLLKQSVEEASRTVIHDELGPAGGVGGAIVLAPDGHAAFNWNTPGMWHGWLTRDGRMNVAVYRE
ncbi:MAG: isoaspartyl peptidase/L-asparaginase [Planctomycetes bacterium]|nr:isoaspartyl peptidase/L-asparaginase [Planctomycetota bacterium]